MLRLELDSPLQDVIFHPGSSFLLGDTFGGLRIWSMPGGEERLRIRLPFNRTNPHAPLTLSDDGHLLTYEHHLLDLGGMWAHLAGERPDFLLEEVPGLVFETGSTLAFCPGGEHLYSLGAQGLDIRDSTTWNLLQHLDCSRVRVAVSACGRRIATGDPLRRQILLHDHWTPRPTLRLSLSGTVHLLAFSPDGNYLAAMTGYPSQVSLFETRRWACLAEFPPFRSWGTSLEFSRDSRRLAASAEEGVVCLWEVASARQLAALDPGIGWIQRVTLAPDGMTAAAAGSWRTLVVWDIDE